MSIWVEGGSLYRKFMIHSIWYFLLKESENSINKTVEMYVKNS